MSSRTRRDTSDPDVFTQIHKQVLEVAGQKLTLHQNGQTKTVSAFTALLQKYMQTALGGSPHALHQVSRIILDAECARHTHIESEQKQGETYKTYKERELAQLIEQARQRGATDEELDTLNRNFVPHPDDIQIDDQGWHIQGPSDEEELSNVYICTQIRDAFVQQDMLDQYFPVPDAEVEALIRTYRRVDRDVFVFGSRVGEDILQDRSAMLFANFFNLAVPVRFRMSSNDYVMAQTWHNRRTKRELLKQCHQTWKSVDMPFKRGWVSPSIITGLRVLTFINELRAAARTSRAKGETLSDEQAFDMVPGIGRKADLTVE